MARSTPSPVAVQKFLSGVDYPATKDDLIERAEDEGADEAIVESLRQLPMDEFASPTDVTEAMSKRA
ncbi:DUF2795 domain-containing protein [Candidatus Parcubacteria bacterium]|nr:MAG: DUF2795 domain-containing protein [Candidatus Parcubacteria bacterium]